MRPYLSFPRAAGVAAVAASFMAIAVFATASTRSRAESSARATSSANATSSAARARVLSASDISDISAALPREAHQFYFTRVMYSEGNRGGFGRGGRSWRTDWPKSDIQFLTVLRRLTIIDAYASDNVITLDDPEVRRFPFLYIVEVGRINLSPEEEKGLRDYMLAGGFVFVDDFWGAEQWYYFEEQMKRVLPTHTLVDLPMSHPIFSAFYHIEQMQTLPSVNDVANGRDTECFGCYIQVKGIFDDSGRLMMLISWNSDHGDAWEWAELPEYPLKLSTYAFQVGVNAIVYTMSH